MGVTRFFLESVTRGNTPGWSKKYLIPSITRQQITEGRFQYCALKSNRVEESRMARHIRDSSSRRWALISWPLCLLTHLQLPYTFTQHGSYLERVGAIYPFGRHVNSCSGLSVLCQYSRLDESKQHWYILPIRANSHHVTTGWVVTSSSYFTSHMSRCLPI